MTRLAMTRDVEAGSEVPVAIKLRGLLGVETDGWKKRAGIDPHVIGAIKDAIAVWPG